MRAAARHVLHDSPLLLRTNCYYGGLADARRAFDGMPHGGAVGVAHTALSLFALMVTGRSVRPGVYEAGAW